MRGAILSLVLILLTAPALAVEPKEMLDDPKLEQRARELSAEIRCLVCQNQSIDESNAGLAEDMRLLIRERIKAGDSNAEIKDYLTARYGDFVLLKPPMKPETYILWYAPAVLVVLGAFGVGVYFWRRRRGGASASDHLSAAEQQRLRKILEERDGAA
ncbi:cytochrome c-type biogenesis protein [Ferruginivarius sediminum]|uniref:Cytochrome c-type biogenesis protein n=1 Tax=Ferruginivarius sediminum TaxID=2661937 RepID=A0A369T5N4_9PROT|nr:cytochrome c-type biogenesis protein [Ferruginivarius sediminum]RDD60588.1 cytochrome c-type biogenesis protein CcmH [Ferruginivarius sediminum]